MSNKEFLTKLISAVFTLFRRRTSVELSRLEWEAKYSVGNQLIDDQHLRLFNLYNRLVDIKKEKQELMEEELRKVVEELEAYIHEHFSTEELAMKLCGYPNLEGHERKHREFVGTVKKFREYFDRGGTIIIESVMIKIRDWLDQHVAIEDQRLKDWLPQTSQEPA
jgi:hemerythrin